MGWQSVGMLSTYWPSPDQQKQEEPNEAPNQFLFSRLLHSLHSRGASHNRCSTPTERHHTGIASRLKNDRARQPFSIKIPESNQSNPNPGKLCTIYEGCTKEKGDRFRFRAKPSLQIFESYFAGRSKRPSAHFPCCFRAQFSCFEKVDKLCPFA